MFRTLFGISIGALLTAACWQLSALLTAAPDDASALRGLIILACVGLVWLALCTVAACASFGLGCRR